MVIADNATAAADQRTAAAAREADERQTEVRQLQRETLRLQAQYDEARAKLLQSISSSVAVTTPDERQ